MIAAFLSARELLGGRTERSLRAFLMSEGRCSRGKDTVTSPEGSVPLGTGYMIGYGLFSATPTSNHRDN